MWSRQCQLSHLSRRVLAAALGGTGGERRCAPGSPAARQGLPAQCHPCCGATACVPCTLCALHMCALALHASRWPPAAGGVVCAAVRSIAWNSPPPAKNIPLAALCMRAYRDMYTYICTRLLQKRDQKSLSGPGESFGSGISASADARERRCADRVCTSGVDMCLHTYVLPPGAASAIWTAAPLARVGGSGPREGRVPPSVRPSARPPVRPPVVADSQQSSKANAKKKKKKKEGRKEREREKKRKEKKRKKKGKPPMRHRVWTRLLGPAAVACPVDFDFDGTRYLVSIYLCTYTLISHTGTVGIYFVSCWA